MQHWNYAELFDVLENKLGEQGVLVHKADPTYTSQRCSKCGWVRKGNRKRKQFTCDNCGHTQDADLNASQNISLELLPITKKQRLLHKKRIGFFCYEVGKEPIVPNAQKVA
jgi:transposase